MTSLAARSPIRSSISTMYAGALTLFVVTIAIGILNGLDVYEPDHDTLMTHVHSGTLGWITLSVAATITLMFTIDRDMTDREVTHARWLSWSMVAGIALYVAAFFAGDRIPGDRIQRPVAGTVLFIVVVWFLVWMVRQNRSFTTSSVTRFGLMLAWISLMVGAVLGIALGIFTARGEVPGLDTATAARFADAHPAAMVIGFLILAGAAVIEWLIRPARPLSDDTWGAAQMLIIFTSGMLVNIAFIIDSEPLLGPANLGEVVGVIILIARLWRHLVPSAWSSGGPAAFGRIGALFLVLDLAVLTYLVSRIMAGTFDFENLSEADLGLALTLDHLMFIGVMTNALMGTVARFLRGDVLGFADRIVLWGTNIGLVGFAVGLVTTTQVLKRISAPVMGTALLIAIAIDLAALIGRPSDVRSEELAS